MRNFGGATRADVVVALSAVLMFVAVTAGAVQNARQDARLALCAGNMRLLGAACLSYAGEWDQTLPPEMLRGVQDLTPAHSSQITDIDSNPWSFGRLLANGYLSTPRVMFCPAQNVARFSVDSAIEPEWPKRIPEATAGYLYQVHSVRNPGITPYNASYKKHFGNGDFFVCAAFDKVSEFPTNLFLTMEVVDSVNSVPHNSGTTMNALFIDGSVKVATTDEYLKALKVRPDSPMANMQSFSEVVTMWENGVK